MDKSNKENGAIKRLAALFDEAVFTEIDPLAKSADNDAEVVAGFGSVNGAPCYAFAQDSSVNSGAITTAQCSKIKKVYDLAVKTGYPVIAIYDSNGVKLTEGFEVLNAYGEIVKAATSVSGVIPQISVIAGACLGTSALMANTADVVIAVKDSDFYISAPSEATVDESSEKGCVDILADDFEGAINEVKKLVTLLPANNLSVAPMLEFSQPAVAPNEASSTMDIINSIADGNSVVELKKDNAGNVITALASVAGNPVGIVAFGGEALCPGCCYKAEAFVKLCDAYNLPVITIANSSGLIKDNNAQMIIASTKLTSAYATATCPKISVITKQAIGTAYIILAGKGANADATLAWDSAVASPLDVDAAVAFLFNDRLANGEDREALKAEYKETIGSAFTAAACGAVDDVFAAAETRAKVVAYLDMLNSKRESTIARKHSVK